MLTVKSKTPSYKTVRKICRLFYPFTVANFTLAKAKECPYCKSELTETERDFFPCTCSFQVLFTSFILFALTFTTRLAWSAIKISCGTRKSVPAATPSWNLSESMHCTPPKERSTNSYSYTLTCCRLSKDIDSHQTKKSDKKSTTTITVVTTVSTKSTVRNDQTSVYLT